MDVATVQAALDVLRSVVYHTIPDSAKVDLLRQAIRSEADGLSAEDLARLVVDHYLMESKARTKTATAGSEPSACSIGSGASGSATRAADADATSLN